GIDSPAAGLIESSSIAAGGFDKMVVQLDKQMEKLAKTLPVAAWAKFPERRGFGLLSLATIIGETGDLNNYPNPAKVWRRMGCAPFTSDGKTLMGATWKSGREGKLSSDEWEEYGYSPRRRSVMFVIGECLVKQNGGGGEAAREADLGIGPYRQR